MIATATKEEFRFPALTAAELDSAEFNVSFLIDDALADGHPAILGAAPKCCKTLLALDAAISIATATPFLGVLPVQSARRSAYFSGEGGLSLLQEYARRIAIGRGWTLRDVTGLFFIGELPQLAEERHVDALARFIDDYELGFVVIDPLYLAMPGDGAENIMRQGKVLRRVNDVCTRRGCTPLLLHHTKRNPIDPFTAPELGDLSWAGFSEFCGQWWMVGRREKYDPDDPGEHRLWLNIGGRLGHSALHALDIHEGSRSDLGGRRWEVDVLRPSEARDASKVARDLAKVQRANAQAAKAADQLEQARKAIVDALLKWPEGESKTCIKTASNTGRRFDAARASLIQDGDVVACEILKSNWKRPIEGFKLAEMDHSEHSEQTTKNRLCSE